MSDVPQGPGWWQASDQKWYPPEAQPGHGPAQPTYGQPTYGTPGYAPPGYGYPTTYGYQQGPMLPSVSGQAVAAMVLGILAVIPCCWPFNAVLGLVGLPLGLVALNKINKGEAQPSGKGQAIAGIALSSLAIAGGIVILVLIIVADSSTTYGLMVPGTVA